MEISLLHFFWHHSLLHTDALYHRIQLHQNTLGTWYLCLLHVWCPVPPSPCIPSIPSNSLGAALQWLFSWKLLFVLLQNSCTVEKKHGRDWLRSCKLAGNMWAVQGRSQQPVRLSHHGSCSCRLWGITWSVIFLNRMLTSPPSSQRLSQGSALWSLPGVSAIPALDIWDTKIKLSVWLNLILRVSMSVCALCWGVSVIFFPSRVSESL